MQPLEKFTGYGTGSVYVPAFRRKRSGDTNRTPFYKAIYHKRK